MRIDPTDLQHIVDQAPVPLFGASRDGELLYVNSRFAGVLGYAGAADALARIDSVETLFAEPAAYARLAGVAERDGIVTNSLQRLRCRDGRPLTVQISLRRTEAAGQPCYVGALNAELSPGTAAEGDAYYRNIYSSIPVGIYRIGLDGRAIRGNAAFRSMFGMESEDELRDRFRADAIYADPERRKELLRQLEIYGRVEGFVSQLASSGPDGRTRWVSETARIVKRPSGGTAYYDGVMEDITARKEADVLRRLADQAERANRIKSEFLASMSHELRTPLNGVIGAAHVLQRSVTGDKERQLAELIVSSGQSLLAILNDILDIAKVEAGRLELEIQAFDPRKMIDEAIRPWFPLTSEKNLSLQVEVADNIPPALRGDARRIRQILSNFLSNAFKFTDAGVIAVSVTARPDGACTRLHVEVRDSGPGVPPEQRARIFDKFYQLKDTSRARGGTGLGLAICRDFATLMGGEVGCGDAPEGGACFWFSAPLHAPAEAVLTERSDAADGASLAGLRIMAAEDNATNREVLSALLENFQCTPIFAEDGRRALETLMGERFDVVLMDIQMPYMDGAEVTRLWREHESRTGIPRVPVIALTANAMEGDRHAYLEAGMDDFVAKPINPVLLLQTILKATRAPAEQAGLTSADVA